MVQNGTRSTPGTSLAKNDGKNSQCQPNRWTIKAPTPKSSTSSAGDIAPPTNKGKTAICSASAMIAKIIAARNRGPAEIVIVSSVMTGLIPSCHYSRTIC